jgi:hypothetical protein
MDIPATEARSVASTASSSLSSDEACEKDTNKSLRRTTQSSRPKSVLFEAAAEDWITAIAMKKVGSDEESFAIIDQTVMYNPEPPLKPPVRYFVFPGWYIISTIILMLIAALLRELIML